MIPWKVCTNDFYSRVAINHKKKPVSAANKKVF